MKKINYAFLFILSVFFYTSSTAQNFVWARSYGGTNYDDGSAVTTDPSGNVIAVGNFSGTVDFDPGPGVANLTSVAGNTDIYITKMTSAGAFIWAKRIGNAGQEAISDVDTDASGNIYAIGSFTGTVDFDPNAGVVNLISAGNQDAFMWKLDPNGNYLLAKSMGGTLNDWATGLDLDAANNIYVIGTFNGNCDFNPSAVTNTATVYGGADIFLAKYDVNMNYGWAFSMGGTLGDYGIDIKVNSTGTTLYSISSFSGNNVDLSPQCGCGTVNSLGQSDICILKQSASSGGFMANAIFAGTSYDSGQALFLDAADNVYSTGSFDAACDFDPGPLAVNLGAAGSNDGFVSKLNSNLNYVWVKQFSGLSAESGSDIVLDPVGNIYVTGSFNGTTDFDPSAATYTASSIGGPNSDCFVFKYDPSGSLVWLRTWGSSNLGDYSSSIALDAPGNIYTTGDYWSTCDFDPGAGVYNLSVAGSTDAFVLKLSCTMPSTITTSASNYTFCAGTSTSVPLIVNAPELGVTYNWSAVGAAGVVFSPTSGTATTMSFTGTNTFSITSTGVNACGTVSTTVGKIVINPSPIIGASASPTAVCSGSLLTLSGSGAVTYTWSNGITNAIPFTPTVSQTYTVQGTNANGCKNSITINVPIINNPILSISGKNLVCLNKPNTLTGSGASTFTWLPGSIISNTINAQPSANTVYTINATGANGCNNSATFAVNLVFPQTPQICMVTVDTLGINNEIFWEKTLYNNVDSFIVYREVSTNLYKRIASISVNAYSGFTDTTRSIGPANGDPNSTSYKYKLQIRDTCGNYSALSLWHQTIFIQDQQNGNFNWNSYAIESSGTPVTVYDLFRINLANNSYSLVTSTTAGLATDPQYSLWQTTAKWRVQANGFNCNPTPRFSSVLNQKVKTKSNIKNDRLVGIKNYEILNTSISTYPSPAKDVVYIDSRVLANIDFTIELQNPLGQIVYTKKYTSSSNEKYQIDMNAFTNGVYFVNIKQEDKTVAVKKIVLSK
ncbi:MAG: SBBP repeat-containing protein [Bacteroidetes bacterium]|nr:SBBP repeat-containing protein [Bacteroidota bacterium]